MNSDKNECLWKDREGTKPPSTVTVAGLYCMRYRICAACVTMARGTVNIVPGSAINIPVPYEVGMGVEGFLHLNQTMQPRLVAYLGEFTACKAGICDFSSPPDSILYDTFRVREVACMMDEDMYRLVRYRDASRVAEQHGALLENLSAATRLAAGAAIIVLDNPESEL